MATGTVKATQPKLLVAEVTGSGTAVNAGISVITASAAKSGYKAIGVVGFYVTGVGKSACRSVYLVDNNKDGTSTAGSGNVAWEVYNNVGSNMTATCRAHVLYEKI